MRLWARDCGANLADLVRNLQDAFVTLAEKDGGNVMPAYTHLQRAQPVMAGQSLLAYVEMLERDRERLEEAVRQADVCPLGSGALAGSTLPLDRKRTAELLGFAAVSRNSIDAVSDRDFLAQLGFACAMAAMHLSRWAEEWIIFSSQEFGFVRTEDAYCTGSSMMPQKRNPDMLELIRGRCGGVYGNLMALLTMLKGQPLAYNRDMQEDKKQIFDATDVVASCLAMAAAVVSHTRLAPERIKAGLDEGYLDATALAEYLVGKGMAFREAHQVVGRLVAKAEWEGKRLAEMTLEDLQQSCERIEADVYGYLSARRVVERYATEGAGGKKQVREQMQRWRKKFKMKNEK
jgi:argininosuccinate lyase